jgi:divalent metal cation (Fe/Co/Zn/Cd) transporter
VLTDFHDIRVVDTAKHHVILFGVNVKPGVSKSRVIESCNEVERDLISVFNEFEIDIKVSQIHQYA